MYTIISLAVAEHYPKYGDLLILLDEAEQNSDNTAHSLAQSFANLYPHIPVTREEKFLKTVQRLAAPTRSSAVGPSKLQGLAVQRANLEAKKSSHTKSVNSFSSVK